MIRPIRLELEGFRSFKEKATISFPEQGAMLIAGRYKDSSLSSGSGKSSILMAIAYALGFCSVPATELKNRYSKHMRVHLVLQDGDLTYGITREPKLQLTVFDNTNQVGETKTGTDAEETIVKLLGAPSDLVKTLTYRAQKEPGVFINATDSDKKEMLSTLLGLTALETAHEKIAASFKELETKQGQANTKLETLIAQIKTQFVDQAKVNELYQAYEAANQRYQSMSQTAKDQTLTNQLAYIRLEIDKCNKASRESYSAANELRNVESNILSTQDQMKKIEEGICYTCKQGWSAGKNSLPQLDEHLTKLKAKKIELTTVISNAKVIEQSLAQFKAQEQGFQQQIAAQNAPLADVTSALQSAKAAYDQITCMVNAYNCTVNAYSNTKQELANLNQEVYIYQHAEKLLNRNGFLGVIFDEVLTEIEVISNDIMGCIPNVSEFSLQINSTAVTKSGNTKKSIVVTLFKDGKDVSVKSLSGGQMCALDLAVDLAISESIRRRSGTRLGWIALDEAMDGLDLESKRSALEAIKRRNSGLILVVDHASEIKESFEAVIEVSYDGRHSTIL